MENKARVIATQELRRSGAAGTMKDSRTKRLRTRSTVKRRAIRESGD